MEGEERVAFDIDADLYARDAFYPENIVEVDEPGIWRDIRMVSLRVNPVQYNPATGELRIYQRLTVRVEYYGTSRTNVLTPRQRPIASHQREIYRSTILNYGFLDLNRGEEGSKQTYDLLIISVDALVPSVASLVAWKNSQLIDTKLTLLSAVPGGTTANDIKNYITSEYNSSNISFVLLVGDINDLPIYTGYTGMISDYWYALLTGSDDWPEVAVGRISATTTTQVQNVVNKSIAFEDSPTGDWLDRALLVANFENAPGKYQQAKEEIRTATDTPSGTYRVMYPTFTTAYGASAANGGDDATNADVTTAINNGQVVVNYRGHGDTGEWWNWNTGGQSFTNADAKALNNGDMTPVVFSIACNNNELDAGECLGEAFTNEDDAAVAFLGATRPSYTTPNHTYDKQLFSAVFDEGLISIGNASNLAAIRIIQQHGSSGLTNARMYLWLGDPSLTFSLDPSNKSYWFVVIDTSGSMGYSGGVRIMKARELAVQKVNEILQDPDDEIALATFGHTNALNLHFNWTRDGTALVNDINGIWAGDKYTLTPLADAACAAANKLITDVPIPPNTNQSRRLFLLADGGENNSSGTCSGPFDPVPNPPWDDNPASWHALVLNTLVGSMIVDLGYLGNIQVQPPPAPPEGSVPDLPTRSGEDSLFLATLVDSTGGDFQNVADTAICGNGILEPGEECEDGFPCPGTDVPVYVRFLCRDCKCVPETNVVVQIPNTECVNPGDYVCLPIWVDNNTGPLGGFELEVEYDYTSMTFVGAEPGEAIEGFEHFTYRLLPCPACGCCKYKILLYGQYDLPNGVENIGEPIPLTQPGGYQVLVELCFVVNSDENLRGLKIPVCWEWEGTVVNDTLVEDWECGENTFSSWSGDTLFASHLLCQFNPDICDDPGDRIQPLVVFQYGVCGQNCGGVDVCPAGPGLCKRGDINYNTLTYEVADAVLFASYFVEGTSVFRYDMAYQICATDVNADGRTLTLSDLVYLIRVILHDAVQIPNVTPSSEVANVIVSGGTISTEYSVGRHGGGEQG
jgi:hypothetical protein